MSSVEVSAYVVKRMIGNYKKSIEDEYNRLIVNIDSAYEFAVIEYNKSNWLSKLLSGKPTKYCDDLFSPAHMQRISLDGIRDLEQLVNASTGYNYHR
jgi:hypothetical protein